MCTEISKKKKNFTSLNRSSNNKSFGVQEKKPMWNKTNGYSLETRARGNHLLHFLPRWGKNWWDLTKKNNKKSTKIFWKGESLRPKRIYWGKNSIQKWYLQVGRCRSTTWETGAEKSVNLINKSDELFHIYMWGLASSNKIVCFSNF